MLLSIEPSAEMLEMSEKSDISEMLDMSEIESRDPPLKLKWSEYKKNT